MNGKTLDLLIVDNNKESAEEIYTLLKKSDLDIHIFFTSTLQDTLNYLETSDVDLILLNLELSDNIGIESFIKIYNEFDVPIVVMTSDEKEDLGSAALRLGAQDYFIKNNPITPNGLRRIILHAISRSIFLRDNVDPQTAVLQACDVLRESTQSLKKVRSVYGAINGQTENDSIRIVQGS